MIFFLLRSYFHFRTKENPKSKKNSFWINVTFSLNVLLIILHPAYYLDTLIYWFLSLQFGIQIISNYENKAGHLQGTR